MKSIGVREFRDRATTYLKESEPVAVKRHGRLIGFYIPVEPKREASEVTELRTGLERLETVVTQILRENDLTEDDLADAFDLSKRDDRPN